MKYPFWRLVHMTACTAATVLFVLSVSSLAAMSHGFTQLLSGENYLQTEFVIIMGVIELVTFLFATKAARMSSRLCLIAVYMAVEIYAATTIAHSRYTNSTPLDVVIMTLVSVYVMAVTIMWLMPQKQEPLWGE